MESPQTVDELIEALSLKTHLKISNTFELWFAVPVFRKWRIEIDHVTYRGEFEKKYEGQDLAELLIRAWIEINKFEAMKAEAKKPLETESGEQIEIPETWSGLIDLLRSGDLSEKEKQNIIFAWYMNSQLPERAEAEG